MKDRDQALKKLTFAIKSTVLLIFVSIYLYMIVTYKYIYLYKKAFQKLEPGTLNEDL